MTPRRLAWLIAALFCLSSASAIAIGRYPDQEEMVTVDDARAAQSDTTFASCFEDALEPERPCALIHLGNFAARARVLAVGVLAAMVLSALAFRRAYDRELAPAGHG